MRTETDDFECSCEDKCGLQITSEALTYGIAIYIGHESIKLSKDQAREFFKQGLEMCEPEAAEQPEFLFIKESDCE